MIHQTGYATGSLRQTGSSCASGYDRRDPDPVGWWNRRHDNPTRLSAVAPWNTHHQPTMAPR